MGVWEGKLRDIDRIGELYGQVEGGFVMFDGWKVEGRCLKGAGMWKDEGSLDSDHWFRVRAAKGRWGGKIKIE